MPSAVPSSPLSLPPFLLQQLPPHHSRLPILTDLTPPPAVRPAQHESTFHEGTSRMLFETLNHQPAPPPQLVFFSPLLDRVAQGPVKWGGIVHLRHRLQDQLAAPNLLIGVLQLDVSFHLRSGTAVVAQRITACCRCWPLIRG